MKIVQIVPGSGGTFYCENCLRDSSLTKCLRTLGHDAMLVPMYLPVFTDEPDVGRDVPVFFGGINVYLQQKFGVFRKTPRWVDSLFDSRWLLKLAARQAGSTRAAGMGEMTLSMIHGAEGRQAKELDRLVTWLVEHEQPEVVHIATIMLIGLARRIKEKLGVPIVVSMQDEHVWLDSLDKPYDRLCWEAISERTSDCDAFVSVSGYYADFMRERVGMPADLVQTVHIGIDTTGYEQAPLTFDPPVLGYLSKMTPSLGFGKLIDAFIELKKKDSLKRLRLRAMGGMTGGDKAFLAEMRGKLDSAGAGADAEFLPELDRASRQEFLDSLSVLCVPIEEGEAFGSFLIESWAAGVPVVMPKVGGFVELIEATGGGIMYDARNGSLSGTLESLLCDPERARELGKAGRAGVADRFTIRHMAENTLKIYGKILERSRADNE